MTKRQRVVPTDDWHQLRLHVGFPEQETYELLRPIVLFGQTAAERAQATGSSERTLDLSFVRDLVRPYYVAGRRPSIDPVVFCMLQLVLFFERLHCERQLMGIVADRLSARWYVGFELHEPLPDHSSLTKFRERYAVEPFRRFFVMPSSHSASGPP